MSANGSATVHVLRGLRFRIHRNDRRLLELLAAAGLNAVRACELLNELMVSWPERRELARDVLVCEQEGDRITHDVIELLNTRRVDTLDHGDVMALASALDDVVDYAEEAADLLGLYRIDAPMERAESLTAVLRDAARGLGHVLSALAADEPIAEHVREVNRLENEGDRVSRAALASLFAQGIDPMVVIRWKDIVERVEEAIDSCEHAVNLAEAIVVKSR